MLNRGTLVIVGLLATATLMLFVLGLAQSISSGFAGFWGGLPYWLIALFVMYLALYDYLDDACEISDGWKSVMKIIGIVYSGGALTFGAWGVSTIYAKRETWEISDTLVVSAVWAEVLWMILALLFASMTVAFLMRELQKHDQA